jgi:tripeptidyl-peptidase-1
MTPLLAGLLACVASASVQVHMQVQHPPELPNGWHVDAARTIGLQPSNAAPSFERHLKEERLDALRKIAMDVSTPSSPHYGHHLNASAIDFLTAPSTHTVASVVSWLRTEKVRFRIHNGRSVIVTAITVGAAERLLRTKFCVVSHAESAEHAVRATDIQLPPGVRAVFGVHAVPARHRLHSSARLGTTRKERDPAPPIVAPRTISGLYKCNRTGSRSLRNRQAVIEVMGQTMKESDLSSFFASYVPTGAWSKGDDAVYKFVGVDGRGALASGEPTLDIEWIMGIAPGVLSEFWLFNGGTTYDFCHALLNFTQTALASDDGPLVYSVSYGYQGDVVGKFQGCSTQEVSSIDDNLAKLAAKGVSVIVSSGDSGSGYAVNKTTGAWSIAPAWPSTSPWVTAVGATRFAKQVVGDDEVASDYFGSGGGFSADFARPSYQDAAVSQYLASAPRSAPWPPNGSFPAGGRATPDVAMIGEGFRVVENGRDTHNDGTSGSAPAFAGLVSLLNEQRLAAGGQPLGHLNPWLYQNSDAFTDITVGTNAVGRQGSGATKYGFPCTKGYDPVTGLGTPRFDVLLERL